MLLGVLRPDNAKSQCLHLYKFSVLCFLRITLKLYACKDAYLFHVSPPCIFKLSFLVEAYAHWSHLVDFSPLCVLKYVLKLQCLQSSLAQDGRTNPWQLCITNLQKKTQNIDKKVPGVAFQGDAKWYWPHKSALSPLCIFTDSKCVLKWSTQIDV